MNNYVPTDRTEELIKDLFTFHPVHGDQPERYAAIRAQFIQLAEFIAKNSPASAEQTLAIRALHLAQMHANSAIAIHEAPETP